MQKIIKNKTTAQEIEETSKRLGPFYDDIRNKTFFISGTTGLIGSLIVRALLHINEKNNLNIKIIAHGRDSQKLNSFYKNEIKSKKIEIIISDIVQKIKCKEKIDYIIHCAGNTSSKSFVEYPIETMDTIIGGTKNILEFACQKNIESMVYLSSMEVYGTPLDDEKVFEERHASIDLCEPRSSYPASKCLSEVMCVSYSSEYNVPAKIIRLTQTLGPGVSYNDQRVFAEFARCAIEGRNIVLATKGETRRNYIYTADAVTAILTVLLKGKIGQAYNAANENTYCSIKEMADFVAKISDQGISVVIDENIGKNRGFAPVLHMNLDTYKLRNIGWYPSYGLKQMYNNLIKTMHNN